MILKNLDEKSFVLGLNVRELPLEPESLDRTAYNKGLQIYHSKKEFLDFNKIYSGSLRFFALQKDNAKSSEEDYHAPEEIKEGRAQVDEKYQSLVGLIKAVPQFESYTKELKDKASKLCQELEEQEKNLFS
jgi:DNA repair ATPase RecN